MGFNVAVYSRSASHEDKDDIVSAIVAKHIAAETQDVEQMAKAAGHIDTDLIMRDMVLNNRLLYGTVNAPPECLPPRFEIWAPSSNAGATP
jgi:hypothetical protein